MTELMVRFQNLIAERSDERGAAMSEYGLLIALVFIAAIVIVGRYGQTVRNAFETTHTTFVDNAPENSTTN